MGSNLCCSYSKAEESKIETLNQPLSSKRMMQESQDEFVMKEIIIPGQVEAVLNDLKPNSPDFYTVEKRLNLRKAIVKKQGQRKLLSTISKSDLISVKDFSDYLEKCKEFDTRHFYVPQETWEDSDSIFVISEVPEYSNILESYINGENHSEAKVVKYLKSLVPVLESSQGFQCFNPEETYWANAEESAVKIVPHMLPRTLFNSPDTKNQYFDSKSQSWTAGVLIYVLLCGKSPFKNDLKVDDLSPVFSFANKHWDSISSLAKNLIMKLLSINPDKRPALGDVLKDSWVSKKQSSKVNLKIKKDLEGFYKKLVLSSAKSELKAFFHGFKGEASGTVRVREVDFLGLGWGENYEQEVWRVERKAVLGLLLMNYLPGLSALNILHSDVANELLSDLGYFTDGEVVETDITMNDFTDLVLSLLEPNNR